MFQKRRTASSFVLVTKYDSVHVPDLLLFQRALKKDDVFNQLSLTESEDGTAQRHNELPVLEHLGLGLELHGADHEDDDAGHQECHAEVEQWQLTSETLVTVTENRDDDESAWWG